MHTKFGVHFPFLEGFFFFFCMNILTLFIQQTYNGKHLQFKVCVVVLCLGFKDAVCIIIRVSITLQIPQIEIAN